jgi:hypothetical protein
LRPVEFRLPNIAYSNEISNVLGKGGKKSDPSRDFFFTSGNCAGS